MNEKQIIKIKTESGDKSLPGQWMLKQGYKLVSKKDIKEMLGVKILQEELDKKWETSKQEAFQKAEKRRSGLNWLRRSEKIQKNDDRFYLWVKNDLEFFLFGEYLEVKVKKENINTYSKQIIPDAIVEKCKNLSKEIPKLKFYVHYPFAEKPMKDPIVTAILGENLYLIGRWE